MPSSKRDRGDATVSLNRVPKSFEVGRGERGASRGEKGCPGLKRGKSTTLRAAQSGKEVRE